MDYLDEASRDQITTNRRGWSAEEEEEEGGNRDKGRETDKAGNRKDNKRDRGVAQNGSREPRSMRWAKIRLD